VKHTTTRPHIYGSPAPYFGVSWDEICLCIARA